MNVFAAGTYDGCHPGHIGFFRACHGIAHGSPVIIAVNTDEFVISYRGKPPLFTFEERIAMVRAVRWVDFAIENDGRNQPGLILGALAAGGVHVSGDDWEPGNPDGKDYFAQIGLADDPGFYMRNGIRLKFIHRTGDWSSTELRSRGIKS